MLVQPQIQSRDLCCCSGTSLGCDIGRGVSSSSHCKEEEPDPVPPKTLQSCLGHQCQPGTRGSVCLPGQGQPLLGCKFQRDRLRGLVTDHEEAVLEHSEHLEPPSRDFPGARAGSASNPASGSAVPCLSRFVG